MAYIWGSDAGVVMKSELQVGHSGTYHNVTPAFLPKRVSINPLKSCHNGLLQAYRPVVPGTEPQRSAVSNAARLLRSRVRIPPGAWIFVCCECCVLSGSLCDELITRPEESYRLCCVVVCDLETSRIGAPYIYVCVCDISNLRVNFM
jgi:hypothetical protein